MLQALKHNLRFILIVTIWIVFAYTNIALLFVIIPVSMIVMFFSGLYLELILGMYLFFVAADLRHELAIVAQTFREIYVLTLTLFFGLFLSRFTPLPKFYLAFIPFIIMGMLTSIISELAFESAQKTLSYFLIMLLVPSFFMAAYREDKAGALRKVVFFGTLVLGTGLILLFYDPSLVLFAKHQSRFKGLFGNPNGLGIFCVIYSTMAYIVLTYYPMLFTKPAKYLIIFCIAASTLMCESRGAIFSIAIFLIFTVLSKKSHFLSVMVLLIAVPSYQWILANFYDLVITFGLEDYFRLSSLESGSGRLIAYEFAWRYIKELLWFGGGMGFTEYIFHAPEHTYYLSINNHEGNAHNSFLTIWLDTGIFGLVAFAYGWGTHFVRAHRNSFIAVPMLFAVAFSASFESWMVGSLNGFMTFFLITLFLLSNKHFTHGELEPHMQALEIYNQEAEQELEYAG